MSERIKTSPYSIRELKENEIFVFGSNIHGFHGGGAACFAFENFGAKWALEKVLLVNVTHYPQWREMRTFAKSLSILMFIYLKNFGLLLIIRNKGFQKLHFNGGKSFIGTNLKSDFKFALFVLWVHYYRYSKMLFMCHTM